MPTWDELDRLTKPRQILVVLAAWVVSLVLRAALDATDPDTLGWTTYIVQLALMGVLVAMCIGRILVLFRSGGDARNAGTGRSDEQTRDGPLVTERSVIIAMIAAVVILRVIRGRGTGDLDAVAFAGQLTAVALLVVVGIRRIVLMLRGRSEFSAWPGFWLSLFVMTAGAMLRRDVSPSFEIVAFVGFLATLVFLLIGIYKAVRHRRSSKVGA